MARVVSTLDTARGNLGREQDIMTRRSEKILQRPEWAMNRSLYSPWAYSDYDLERPMIGVATPEPGGARPLQPAAGVGVRAAGHPPGRRHPVEFGVIAACDGHRQRQRGQGTSSCPAVTSSPTRWR